MMKLRQGRAMRLLLLPALLLSSLSPLALGQTGAPSAAAVSPSPATPTTIRNAPFSATVVAQYARLLPDGKKIRHEIHGRVYRDRVGRVRTETAFSTAGDPDKSAHIVIQDPLLHEVIYLYPRSKTAVVRHVAEASVLPKFGVVTTNPQAGSGASAPAPKPETHSESLGGRWIGGVFVTGLKTTRKTEDDSGEAVVARNETWYSHDLQMVILSDSNDGQEGHSLMRVTNVERGEPNPQLFQVPADYTLKETPASIALR